MRREREREREGEGEGREGERGRGREGRGGGELAPFQNRWTDAKACKNKDLSIVQSLDFSNL